MGRNCGIYKIENEINGKVYIGSSRNLTQRFRAHRSKLNYGNHENDYLQKSWNKYEKENFRFDILLYCNEENLEMYEQLCMDEYKCYKRSEGYNIEKEAETKSLREETKRKLSESHKGKNAYFYGKSRSESFIEKMSGENNPIYGRTRKKEVKRKISEKLTGHDNQGNGEENSNSKLNRVDVISIKKELSKNNKTYTSIAKDYDVSKSCVGKISRGETWTHVEVDKE